MTVHKGLVPETNQRLNYVSTLLHSLLRLCFEHAQETGSIKRHQVVASSAVDLLELVPGVRSHTARWNAEYCNITPFSYRRTILYNDKYVDSTSVNLPTHCLDIYSRNTVSVFSLESTAHTQHIYCHRRSAASALRRGRALQEQRFAREKKRRSVRWHYDPRQVWARVFIASDD